MRNYLQLQLPKEKIDAMSKGANLHELKKLKNVLCTI